MTDKIVNYAELEKMMNNIKDNLVRCGANPVETTMANLGCWMCCVLLEIRMDLEGIKGALESLAKLANAEVNNGKEPT